MTRGTQAISSQTADDAPANTVECVVAAVVAWWWRPRRGHVAVESFMLGLAVINPAHFVACTLVLALVSDLAHDRHTLNGIRRGRIVHERYRKATGRTRYRPVAAFRAVRPEVALTPLQRDRRWFARMCEVRNITPAPTIMRRETVDGGRKLTLRLNAAGKTVGDFRKDYGGAIRHYLGKVHDVRIADHPTNAAWCYLYIIEEDLLAKPLGKWPHLTAELPGTRSIADGLTIGKDAAGKDITLDLVSDCVFIGGQRGMGKSTLLHVAIADLMRCGDVEPHGWDAKEGAELGVYEHKFHRWADTPAEMLAQARDLQALRAVRTRELRKRGLRRWEPGCGMKFIALVIDEVAECDDGTPGPTQQILTQIVRLGRSAGIGLIVATQRPTTDYIDPSFRAQFTVGISFRVRPGDEQVTLGPGAKSLGLNPARLPRFQFIALSPDSADGITGRSWMLDDNDVKDYAARLPTHASEVSDGPVRSDADLTPEHAHIEPLGADGCQMSDRLEPPDAIAANPKHLALWESLPAASAAEAGNRSGYSRQHAGMLLRSWAERGLVTESWDGWRHRDPATATGDLA